ncbi:DUF5313 family protein [Pseudonocardia bannensis]|uniref:DUF5313 domain-containing protein n=1 Tax=Pseudonocardia bannensis TaxID=630973 RepID=A0A848DMD3_9PSEU|nr:DUF5313 family protein [Pseudonocardia bannensis]NMH93927.1 DUF5313 domain-containing protein [Pseudonocardia bannensis]
MAGTDQDGRRRPGPIRWVAYALGFGLPPKHRSWVLHDVTTKTWQLRHLARTAVQLAPIAVLLFVLIPGPAWVRGAAVLSGLLLGFFYSIAYMYETAEHRAVKAGYPQGTAAAVRGEATADRREARQRRYAERWRELPPT